MLVSFVSVCVVIAAAWSLLGAEVPLGPCGLGVLRYQDGKWTVLHEENFTASSAPPHWQGRGFVTSVTSDRLTYRDLSGAQLTFTPGSTNPTGCS